MTSTRAQQGQDDVLQTRRRSSGASFAFARIPNERITYEDDARGAND